MSIICSQHLYSLDWLWYILFKLFARSKTRPQNNRYATLNSSGRKMG